MDHQVPGTAGDRGADRAIPEVDFGAFHRRPVGANGCLQGVGIGLKLVVLVLRDNSGLKKLGGALRLRLGVLGLGDVPGQRGFGLFEPRLIGARIDRKQEIARLHVPAFLEVDPVHLAIDLRPYRYGRISFHVSDDAHFYRDGLLSHAGGGYRHRHTHGRRRPTPLGAVAGASRQNHQPGKNQKESRCGNRFQVEEPPGILLTNG